MVRQAELRFLPFRNDLRNDLRTLLLYNLDKASDLPEQHPQEDPLTNTPIPAPGNLYDVGGYRLHLQCQGHGSPAAIFDTGLGFNSTPWANVLPETAKYTCACAFDRAGYGWSEPAPEDVQRTSRQIVEELRILLRAGEIPAPYILVGHSFGAINMLVFAYTYPQEVAGLVLVDPSHPEMFTRVQGVPSPAVMRRSFQAFDFLGRLGLLRWIGPAAVKRMLPNGEVTLPPEAWNALLAFASDPQQYQTAGRETEVGIESFAQARGGPGSLGDLPVIVLSADWWVKGKQTSMKRSALELRKEMTVLSSHAVHRFVEDCDHSTLPVLRPEAVAGAVKEILDSVRSG